MMSPERLKVLIESAVITTPRLFHSESVGEAYKHYGKVIRESSEIAYAVERIERTGITKKLKPSKRVFAALKLGIVLGLHLASSDRDAQSLEKLILFGGDEK